MKDKLKNLNKLDVFKSFVAAHVYMIVAIAIVALIYVVIASIAGRDSVEIVSYAQTAGIFSILGIISSLASLVAVYCGVKKYLFKNEVNPADTTALELLFVLASIILYFIVSGFNIFSYLVVMLVPTIVAYYVSKRRSKED